MCYYVFDPAVSFFLERQARPLLANAYNPAAMTLRTSRTARMLIVATLFTVATAFDAVPILTSNNATTKQQQQQQQQQGTKPAPPAEDVAPVQHVHGTSMTTTGWWRQERRSQRTAW